MTRSIIRAIVIAITLLSPAVAGAAEAVMTIPANDNRSIIVPVLYNSQVIAAVHLRPDMRFRAADLNDWVRQVMAAPAQQKFASLVTADGTVSAQDVAAAGFDMTYDAAQAVFVVHPQANQQQRQNISMMAPVVDAYQDVLQPAKTSAFVNVRGGQDFIYRDNGDEGRQAARLDFDGAVNVHDYVLENRTDYLEGSNQPLARDETRLVHDLPDKMIRLAAGDLSYPVDDFQSYQPMLGVSIARNFDLQPYRVTRPTGETSFVVRTPSRVDVLINGQRIKTLRLEPGSYDISDFPVADGNNNVTLIITDATGNVEEKVFPLLGDQKLLKAGLNEYSYNVGIESSNNNRDITYYGSQPALSFFHRYGFTDSLTGGASAQGDQTVQQAGVSLLKAYEIGTFDFSVAGSHSDEAGADAAGSVGFRRHNIAANRDFSAEVIYHGMNFTRLGQPRADSNSKWETAARYNQIIGNQINFGVGGRYRFGGENNNGEINENDWSYNVNLSKTFSNAITLTLNGQEDRERGAGVLLAMTWSPPRSRHSLSASVDTMAKQQEVSWNYRADRDVQAVQASAGVTRSDGKLDSTGALGYTGYRGEISARQDVTTGTGEQKPDMRSSLLFGTALAWADGQAAITRPITGSFIMVDRDKNLDGHDIGINSQQIDAEHTSYQGEINDHGPAVIPDAVPYLYRPIRVDTKNLPAGYDIGRDNFVAFPSYKSGALLKVGNAANIYADGYLVTADGTPVPLQAGNAKLNGAPATDKGEEFFTNGLGRFRITHLQPGVYTLQLYNSSAPITFTVPDMKPGRFDAGKLIIQGSKPG